jgi:hypothetical protein
VISDFQDFIDFVYGVVIYIALAIGFTGMAVIAVGYALRLDGWLRLGKLYLLRPAGALIAFGFIVSYLNALAQRNGEQPRHLNPFVLTVLEPYQAMFLGWIKWMALACIVALGFAGITCVAVGRMTGNLDWSQYGQRGLLLGGFLAGLLGTMYGLFRALFETV